MYIYQIKEGRENFSEEEVMQLTNVFYDNRYEYQPDLYQRNNVDKNSNTADFQLLIKIKIDMEQRIKKKFRFILVKKTGEIVAYNNHFLNKNDEYNKKIEIGTTCVTPKHHGKGIGQNIYSIIEEFWMKDPNIKEIIRTTWSTNYRQIHLYGKNGYEEIERVVNHYGVQGIDKITFSKKVN